MPLPTVYFETSVIGHLVGRIHPDPVIAGRQTVTREWWATSANQFYLLASELVADECSDGDSRAVAERLGLLKSCEFVETSIAEARALALALHANHAVPTTEPRDALHISLAALNRVEYLLTWNFKHIANPATRGLIEQTCKELGYLPPKICTPADLAGVDHA